MSGENSTAVSAAAISVINTLQPLAPDERSQVLNAAAALYGTQLSSQQQNHQSGTQQDASSVEKTRREGKKPVSVGEFLREKAPATNAQRIACFAYYREKYEDQENFSKSDLAGYFAAARVAKPGDRKSVV